MRLGPRWVPEDIDRLPVCEGPARDDDLARDEQNRKGRAGGRLVREHGLPIKITAADFLGAANVFVLAPHS